MDARYSFRTVWRVDAAPGECWAEIERVATGRSGGWWRALRVVRPATALEPGAELTAVVRAPFGYRLRFRLRIGAVDPGRFLSARSTGDLEGLGRIEVVGREAGSEVRIAWDVELRRPWMRAVSPLLRPVFVLAHGLVMRAGERGIREALRTSASGVRKPVNRGSRPGPGATAD